MRSLRGAIGLGVAAVAFALALASAVACGTTLPRDEDTSSDGGAATDATGADRADAAASSDSARQGDASADAPFDAGSCVATIDCGASCSSRCPSADIATYDTVIVDEVDTTHVFLRNEADCNRYQCTVVSKLDAFDCKNPPLGRPGKICSTGGGGSGCSVAFTVGVSNIDDCNSERCTYACTIVN